MMPAEGWATIIAAGIQGGCTILAACIAAGWISYWNKKKDQTMENLLHEIQNMKMETKE